MRQQGQRHTRITLADRLWVVFGRAMLTPHVCASRAVVRTPTAAPIGRTTTCASSSDRRQRRSRRGAVTGGTTSTDHHLRINSEISEPSTGNSNLKKEKLVKKKGNILQSFRGFRMGLLVARNIGQKMQHEMQHEDLGSSSHCHRRSLTASYLSRPHHALQRRGLQFLSRGGESSEPENTLAFGNDLCAVKNRSNQLIDHHV